MDNALRQFVRQRANNCCEYCQLQQSLVPFVKFHVDHIVARQHGGTDEPDNLALACFHCNLHKGPNLTGIDPDNSQITPLFNPRKMSWDQHFSFQGPIIVGLTAEGRTTVRVLAMNATDQMLLRAELQAEDDT